MVKPPSQKLDDLLMCRVRWEDAEPPIRSWAMLYIYEAACELLDLPTKPERQKMLSCIPSMIRPRIESEAIRLHGMRKGA